MSQHGERLWDVAILGAGMGGGFAAHALAEGGHDVLLVDYGNENISSTAGTDNSDDPETRIAESKWPTMSAFEIDGVVNRSYPPFGVGVGGSANWYAAALERFDDRDIDLLPDSVHPTGGWPISYNQLLPYYEKAERLLHVSGTSDPLNPHAFNHISEPPPLGPLDADFLHFFQKSGTLIDCMSAFAIDRAVMSALADCATKAAARTCVLCLLNPKTNRRSWHAVR
jgi:choline dehydrogenase-like flavoprotein